jgi:HK97 family phage portal protein
MQNRELSFKELWTLTTGKIRQNITEMLFPGSRSSMLAISSREVANYREIVGDGRGNSIVMGVIEWMCRVFPESPCKIEQINRGGKSKTIDGHPMELLLKRPNPFYSGTLLWNGTIGDWMLGNAYWRVIPAKGSGVAELWWIPSKFCRPIWDKNGTSFINYYEYDLPNGDKVRVDPEYMVHLRNGLDPDNPRLGLTKLGSLLKEIYTDEEAANFSASLLSNLGVPGMIISPGSDKIKITTEEADNIKNTTEQRFGTRNRGRVMVMTAQANIERLSFSPDEMNLRDVRKLPEERVTALWGVPAVVVGLGAGLDRSTFANFAEAREAAYESVVIPNQRLLAEELGAQLLPRFERNADNFNVFFDISKVRVLQTDQNSIHQMAREDWKAGLIMLDEAREIIGSDPLPKNQGQVFAIPSSLTITLPDELVVEPAPVPPALAEAPPQDALPPGQNQEPTPLGAAQNGDNLPEKPGDGVTGDSGASQGKGALDIEFKRKRISTFTANRIPKIRSKLETGCTRAVNKYFSNQAKRIAADIRGKGFSAVEFKISADEVFNADEAERELRDLLKAWYLRSLDSVHEMTQSAIDIDFELDDPVTRDFLRDSGTKIRNIQDTTLEYIRSALIAGQQAGEGPEELANRIKQSAGFGEARARVVARTEMGHSTNLAALYVYRASNVVTAIQIHDSDNDDACSEWAGRIVSLQMAGSVPTLGHPNCVRAFGAYIAKADEMEDAA